MNAIIPDYSEALCQIPRQSDLLTKALAAREYDEARHIAEAMARNIAMVRVWIEEQEPGPQ